MLWCCSIISDIWQFAYLITICNFHYIGFSRVHNVCHLHSEWSKWLLKKDYGGTLLKSEGLLVVPQSLVWFAYGSRRFFAVQQCKGSNSILWAGREKKTKLKIIIIVHRDLCHSNCFLLIGDGDSAMRHHHIHWQNGRGISAVTLVHPICEWIYGYGPKCCTKWFP